MELLKFDLQLFAEGGEGNEDNAPENIDIPESTPEEQAMKETLSQLENELAEAEAKATELEQKMGALTEAFKGIMSILGLTSEQTSEDQDQDSDKVKELKQTIETLQASLDAMTKERDSLLDEVAEFRVKTLKALAEQVVNLKVSLGDITEEEKEAELNRLAEKSEDTLLFFMEELQKRAERLSNSSVSTRIPKVSNPAMVENNEPQVIEVDDEEGEAKENTTVNKKISPVDIYKELLTGKRFK